MEEEKKFFDKPFGKTTFTYKIKTKRNREAISLGINCLKENSQLVLLFCSEINEIKINENNKITIIGRNNYEIINENIYKSKLYIQSEDSYIENEFITGYIEEESPELTNRFKKKRDLRLSITIKVDENKNILLINEGSPNIFCIFPLIGSEYLKLPFIINSPDFEPNEERNFLMLSGKDDEELNNRISSIGINRLLLSKSTKLFETVLNYILQNVYNNFHYLFQGLKNVPNDSINFDSKKFIDIFQTPIKNILIKYDVITVNNEKKKIHDVIFPSYSGLNQNFIQRYHELLTKFYPNQIPNFQESIQWSQFIWKNEIKLFNLTTFIQTLQEKIELKDDIVIYNELLSFINEYDQTLLDKYSLIPNQKGKLKKLNEQNFYQDINIHEDIIYLFESLKYDWKEYHMDKRISSIKLHNSHNIDNIIYLVDEIINIIKNKYPNDINPFKNCLFFKKSTENSGSKRRNYVIKFSQQIFKLEGQNEVILDEIPDSIWKKIDGYLIELIISRIDIGSFYYSPISKDDLNDFYEFLINNIPFEKLKKRKIFYSQDNQFKKFDDLQFLKKISPNLLEAFNKFYFKIDSKILHTNITVLESYFSGKIWDIDNITSTMKDEKKRNTGYDELITFCSFLPEESQMNYERQKSLFWLLSNTRQYSYFSSRSNYTIPKPEIIKCNNKTFWEIYDDDIINYITSNKDRIKISDFESSELIKNFNFLHSYSKGFNLCLNQRQQILLKSDLYQDENIPEDLKEILLYLDSKKDYYSILVFEGLNCNIKNKKTISDIVEDIDKALSNLKKPEEISSQTKRAINKLFNEFLNSEEYNNIRGNYNIFKSLLDKRADIELKYLFTTKERKEMFELKEKHGDDFQLLKYISHEELNIISKLKNNGQLNKFLEKQKNKPDPQLIRQIGYIGEYIVFKKLKSLNLFQKINWKNKNKNGEIFKFNEKNIYIKESNKHYDIKCLTKTNQKIYIEIKTSEKSYENAKDSSIKLSNKQYEFLLNSNEKSNKYIFRVFNIYNKNPIIIPLKFKSLNKIK